MTRGLLIAFLMLTASAAEAEPLQVTTTPLTNFSRTGSEQSFGPLRWQGGLVIEGPKDKFGGLSGLFVSDDCKDMLAVSDLGRWFRSSIDYKDGRLAGVSDAEYASLLGVKGAPLDSKSDADAEALTRLSDGRYLVGFERNVRLGLYDIGKEGLAADMQLQSIPKDISLGPGNAELESLAHFNSGPWNGYTLAVSETNLDAEGNIRAWIWNGDQKIAFSIKRFETYSYTDSAILSDGDVLLLARSYQYTAPPSMALLRFDAEMIAQGTTVMPELLFAGRADAYEIDNMEGVAVCSMGGHTRISILSDDNLNPLQRTLLLQFDYDPKAAP